MRFLILGAGSIGSRHGRILTELGHRVLVWDPDPECRDRSKREFGAEVATGVDAGLAARPDGVLVCTPPASHVTLARQALAANAHVFVEKPLAHVTDEVPALLDCAKRAGRAVAVGFNLRFLPSLRRVKALLEQGGIGKVFEGRAEFGFYLPAWRATRDYRENYAISVAQGGGILLDAIHEFDYLCWLFGEVAEVFCAAAHVSALAGDTEDLAEVMLRFESGVLAQVHVDYLRRAYRRELEIIGAEGVIVWDYATRAVRVFGPAPDHVVVDEGADDPPNNAMYVEEMRHFIRCIEGKEAPVVDGWEAFRSLRVVEAAKTSASCRQWIAL